MGVIQRVSGFAREFAAFLSNIDYPTYSSSIPSVVNNLLLNPESIPRGAAYELVPSVYGCIGRRQSSVAELPLEFYSPDGELLDPEAVDGQGRRNVYGLFEFFNAEESAMEHMEQIVGSLDIHGAAYDILQYTDGGRPGVNLPSEIITIPGYAMAPEVDSKRHIVQYILTDDDGRRFPIPTWQVIPYRMYSTKHDLRPLAPLDVARLAFSTERDMHRWLLEFYKRGAMVGGVISTKEGFMPNEKALIEKDIELRRRNNPFRPFVMPNDAKFEKMGLTMAEMDFLATSGMTRSDIAMIYRVPPWIIGVKEGGSLSDAGAKADLLLYWEICLKPTCQRITSAITHHFLKHPLHLQEMGGEAVRCGFNLEQVLPLQQLNFERGSQLMTAVDKTITLNEWRDMMNMEPYDDPRADIIGYFDQKEAEMKQLAQPPAFGKGGRGASASMTRPTDGTAKLPLRLEATIGTTTDFEAERATRDTRKLQCEALFRKGLRKLFAQQERRVIAGLRELHESPRMAATMRPELAAALHVEELLTDPRGVDLKLIRRYLRAVAKHAGDAELADIGRKIEFQLRDAEVREWLAARAAEMIRVTGDTTNKELRDSIGEGISKHETLAEIRSRVIDVFRERYAGQGDNIVRTETNAAYGFAANRAWQQSSVVVGKRWVTSGDERVREMHREVDGQTVGMGEMFEVGGEFLEFPGDWAHGASPDNLCRCRCSASPIVDQSLLATLNRVGAGMNGNGHGSVSGIAHLLAEVNA